MTLPLPGEIPPGGRRKKARAWDWEAEAGSEPRRRGSQLEPEPESLPAWFSGDHEVRGSGGPGSPVRSGGEPDSRPKGRRPRLLKSWAAATWPQEARTGAPRGSGAPNRGSPCAVWVPPSLLPLPKGRGPVGLDLQWVVISSWRGWGPERTEVSQLCPPPLQLEPRPGKRGGGWRREEGGLASARDHRVPGSHPGSRSLPAFRLSQQQPLCTELGPVTAFFRV